MTIKCEKIFDKAYRKLEELYSEKHHKPDIRIISRFYEEKKILIGSELYICFLDLVGRLKNVAAEKGECVTLWGTTGSSFIAYLLGATDVNPLPSHEYCPTCHKTNFRGEENPFDRPAITCSCGADIVFDGYNIPFESNIESALNEYIDVRVSYKFFKEAKQLILNENSGKRIITLENEDMNVNWFCFADDIECENKTCTFKDFSTNFSSYPHITLRCDKTLDKYRELENVTGVKWEETNNFSYSCVPLLIESGTIYDIPHFNNDFCKEIIRIIKPKSYGDLLKLIGLASSTNVWKNNTESLYYDHKLLFKEIPAFREELYDMICDKLRKKGIYETGFAYEVTEKTRKGFYFSNGGVDDDTLAVLLELGFDTDFISFIENVLYMFPKANAVNCFKNAMKLIFYKMSFSDEYDTIIKGI